MPTFAKETSFLRDYANLSQDQKAAFREAVAKFVEDLRRGTFRKGLRVKRVQSRPGVWEMTWADDGRATFAYGASIHPGQPHIIWRRIGSHDIFDNP
jgi:hypothetical protein